MGKARPYQQWQLRVLFVEEILQFAHALHHQVRGRRHEERIPRPSSADPVLAAPKLAGFLLASPSLRKQHAVDLSKKAKGKRESASKTIQPITQRGYVV